MTKLEILALVAFVALILEISRVTDFAECIPDPIGLNLNC